MDRKKKKVAGNPTKTVDSVKDARFAHILKNPVYRPVPKKEKKIEIDKRFQGMFNDEKFKLKYKTDKRGRPVETTTDENLKRYYNLVDNEKDEEDGEDTLKKTKPKRGKEKPKNVKINDEDDSSAYESEEESNNGLIKEESDSDNDDGGVKEKEITRPVTKVKLDEGTRKKLHSSEVDYARGEANLVSGSSSDDDSSDEEIEQPMVHDWGELDKDAHRTEDSTKRLALCNMDWDRVRAVDLMVLLSSFLPPGELIRSIKIYPSEFGKERMAEEDLNGPKELVGSGIKLEINSDDDNDSDANSENSGDEDGEGSRYYREKLRQYQLSRLKYYYAVVEFDSVQTAEKIYTECDGMEYESSAAKIDLRFIPEDMTFDEEPRDICTSVPDTSKYRPRFFTTTALQQIKVDLTWDETDPLRKELTEKIFDPKEKIDDDDIRAYLATSSEESEESEPEKEPDEEGSDESDSQQSKTSSKQDSISKYKALLQSIESSEKKKKEKDIGMEITWGVGLKEKTEKLVKKKLEEDEKSKRTPWEEMLDKRREKRLQRKQERKKDTKEGSGSDDDTNDEDEQPFSDDDVDVDMSDEFFREEMKTNDILKEYAKKSKQKKTKDGNEQKTKPIKDASLELLLMDDDDKKHFSLKKIMENETDTKSKKKRKMKKRKLNEDQGSNNKNDDFEIDVGDHRFSALFNSHHFNVDPSDPNYKKTKSMERIIAEKQKRRMNDGVDNMEVGRSSRLEKPTKQEQDLNNDNTNKQLKISKKAELSYLVKSIKRNTANLKSKKPK